MYTLKSDNFFYDRTFHRSLSNIFLILGKIIIDFRLFSQYNDKRIDKRKSIRVNSNSGRIPLLHKQKSLRDHSQGFLFACITFT